MYSYKVFKNEGDAVSYLHERGSLPDGEAPRWMESFASNVGLPRKCEGYNKPYAEPDVLERICASAPSDNGYYKTYYIVYTSGPEGEHGMISELRHRAYENIKQGKYDN